MKAQANGKQSAALNTALFKALGHPTRSAILIIAGDREVTPTELSEILDLPLSKVYPQVRSMASGDEPLLELVGTDTRRGGTMHYYKAIVRPLVDASAWDELPLLARQAWSAVTCGMVIDEIASSVESGRFDAHPNRITVRRPVKVDREGASKIEEAAIAYDEACVEAETESALRGGECANMLSATFLFDRASG